MAIGWLGVTEQDFWVMIAFVCGCFLAGVFVGWCSDHRDRRR